MAQIFIAASPLSSQTVIVLRIRREVWHELSLLARVWIHLREHRRAVRDREAIVQCRDLRARRYRQWTVMRSHFR